MNHTCLRDPQQAFRDAIQQGLLSEDPASPVFADDFMYMGTIGGRDGFKHVATRQYTWVPAPREASHAA